MSKAKKTKLDQLLQHVPEETRRLVQLQDEIAMLINSILKHKGWTQKEFAQIIGMKESQLSKILAGNANLTLKTISKIETILERDIISVPHFLEKTKPNTILVSYKNNQYSNEYYTENNPSRIHSFNHKTMPLSINEYNIGTA